MNLCPHHLKELEASGIDEALAGLNFYSLDGNSAIGRIAGNSERTNTGRIANIQSYAHLWAGGMWCATLDPLDNWVEAEWGVIKPDSPREYDGKLIKYESPRKVQPKAFFQRITKKILEKICANYQIEFPALEIAENGEILGFWEWVKSNPKLPVIVTEGAKKSAALLSCGLIAIALPGIAMGYRKGSDSTHFLIPELEFFADGREIIFCFDNDSKMSARKNSQINIEKMAKLFKAKNCEISCISWRIALPKGIDDVKVSEGEGFVISLFKGRVALKNWRRRETWILSRGITPDEKVDNPGGWYSHKMPEANAITGINSGLGTGKTTESLNNLNQLDKEGYSIQRNLGYRNSLLRQFNELARKAGLNFKHLNEDFNIREDEPKTSNCVHSILQYKPEDFDNCILILDEVTSVVRALHTDRNIKKHSEVLAMFKEALIRSNRVIALDGLLHDWVMDYLHKLAPNKRLVKVKNVGKKEKPQVNFLMGTKVNEKIKANDRTPWLKLLLGGSARPAIASDSQVFIEGLDKLLKGMGLRGIRIDSKTVAEDEDVKLFLKDSNAYINDFKPDYILYTSSAESGIDINVPDYFSHHFSFFFGVLSIDSYLQLIGRVRDTKVERFVWCKEFVSKNEADFNSTISSFLEKNTIESFNLDLQETFSNEPDEELKNKIFEKIVALMSKSVDDHFRISQQIRAIDNYEKSNLRACLLDALDLEGYPVRLCTGDEDLIVKKVVKDAVDDVKLQNCTDIFKAERIDISLLDHSSGGSHDCKWSERVKFIQAGYRKQLPGIENTEIWSEEFIYLIRYDNPRYLSQWRRLWMLKNPEVCRQISKEKYNRIFKSEGFSLGRWRSEKLIIDALEKLGIKTLIDNPGIQWKEEDEVIQGILKRATNAVCQALGKFPGKSKMKFVGGILRMLGLDWHGDRESTGERKYAYQVVFPDEWGVVEQCLTRRYQEYLDGSRPDLEWETPAKNLPIKTAETVTPQGVDAVQMLPKNIINRETSRRILDLGLGNSFGVDEAGERKAKLREATEWVKTQIREAVEFDSPASAKAIHTQVGKFLSQFGEDAKKIQKKVIKELTELATGEWENYSRLVWGIH